MKDKISISDILSIRPGKEKIFYLSSEKARWTARILAYQQVRRNPRPDVVRYSCHNGRPDKQASIYPIAIKAIAPGQYE